MRGLRGTVATYAPAEDAPAPDLANVDGVVGVQVQPSVRHSTVYFDTPDLALLHNGVSLRRRTGGPEEGWYVAVPGGRERDEIQRPLGRSVARPPTALRDLTLGWTRGAALVEVAVFEADRSPSLLLGPEGEVIAEFADDRVTGTTPEGAAVARRAWELALVSGTEDLLDAADRRLESLGVQRSGSSWVADPLGDRLPPPRSKQAPSPGKPVSLVVLARLPELVDELARRDVDVRRGLDEGVHKMRVACRRLRSLLATFRPVLDGNQVEALRSEIRWLAGVLGEARDAAVVYQRLRDLLADEPRQQVRGPVLRRLRSTYVGRGKADVVAALGSQRYFDLRNRLDGLVADPPWTELADAPARDVVPQRLRKELKRFRRRVRSAEESDDPVAALHDARKAVKRLRYAAEAVEPVAGKPAHRLAREARRATSHLGELQDTVVTRAELLALARDAETAGEPTFTYGRLHAREEARARQLVRSFRKRGMVGELRTRTRAARRAAAGR